MIWQQRLTRLPRGLGFAKWEGPLAPNRTGGCRFCGCRPLPCHVANAYGAAAVGVDSTGRRTLSGQLSG